MQFSLVSTVEWFKKNGRWICSFISYDGVFNQMWLESGSDMSFKIQQGRYCVGYTTTSSHISKTQIALELWKALEPCPLKAQITKGYKCSSCSGADLVHPCLICDGTKCLAEQDLQRICHEATAYVYIASFGPNQVKVGVAHQSRIPRRWIEQGANLAKRIMIGNGMEVRKFETAIHNSLNVLSGLRTSLKVDTIWKEQTKKEIIALTKMEEKIKERFPEFPFYDEPFQDLSKIYDLPILKRRPIELKVKKNQQITGKIMGAKGSLLLLSVNNLPHFLNLKHLLGRKITLNKTTEIISQRILDEF